MTFEEQNIKGVYKITLNPILDKRGWFARSFCSKEFKEHGIRFDINQINHSYTSLKGSFRGIHYQFGKFAEYKLVRCIAGSVIDYAVDLRKNSRTLYQNIGVELSDSNLQMLLLPPGVGHAFQTLENNTSLIYLHSSFYNKEYEGGFKYNDPKINLNLPLEIMDISERDQNHSLIDSNFLGIDYEL